ncbi:MAG: transporter [Opitutae bacterium]|nr:transporter [Opitutae bacterium]
MRATNRPSLGGDPASPRSSPTVRRPGRFAAARLGFLLGALGAVATAASADPAAARAMVTDRPSKTDGPFTLDAGRGQLETEFFTVTHDADAGGRTRALSLGSVFLRWGVTPQFELQLGWQSYARVTTTDAAGARTRAAGFGDTVVRAKYNFWGNDGGATAFSLLPFAKIPTNRGGLGNDAVEGGLSLPFIVNLPAGWQLGLMAKWSRLLASRGHGRENFWEYSVIGGRALTEKLSCYSEAWVGRSAEPGVAAQRSLGLGLGYALNDRWCLDAGVNLALNRATADTAFFCGTSVRF